MARVPGVAKYRRSIGEVAFILVADCPQPISMATWNIKKMMYRWRLLVVSVAFRLRIGLARILSAWAQDMGWNKFLERRFRLRGMQGVEEDHN
jgi:hypothetical protein